MYTYIIVAEAVSIPFRSKAASNQSQQRTVPWRGSGLPCARLASCSASISIGNSSAGRTPNIQPESY